MTRWMTYIDINECLIYSRCGSQVCGTKCAEDASRSWARKVSNRAMLARELNVEFLISFQHGIRRYFLDYMSLADEQSICNDGQCLLRLGSSRTGPRGSDYGHVMGMRERETERERWRRSLSVFKYSRY